VFEAKVIVGNYTSQTKTNKMMFLTINDQDVPKMENLTKNNVGKRMLIVCRGEVISAPVIMMPIASNKFQVQVQDSGFLDRLKK
jgi:preprotein translocase subunit SecD